MIKLDRFLSPWCLLSSEGRKPTNNISISMIICSGGMYEENTWNIIDNDGCYFGEGTRVSVKLLWLHIIENLMIISILGALIIYQKKSRSYRSQGGFSKLVVSLRTKNFSICFPIFITLTFSMQLQDDFHSCRCYILLQLPKAEGRTREMKRGKINFSPWCSSLILSGEILPRSSLIPQQTSH